MIPLNKPTFPPGWILPNGIKIIKRVDKQQFVEVFLLDSGEYLYVFHEKEIKKKLEDRKISYDTLFLGNKPFISKKYSTHIHGDITERLKSLFHRRGLEAIAGMQELKKLLIRDVIQPFLQWESYQKYGITPSNGILFFGPPGCGKTFIAKKLAEALRAELLEISEGSIGSPYIHATSNNIIQTFKKAEQIAPCVLFIDEISGLMPRRDTLSFCEQYREGEINEFLMHIEGSVNKKILVVGATNFPEKIDPAILRSGRMDKRIFIPPPDKEARYQLFELLLEERPTSKGIDLNILTKLTEGLICSDLKLIVNNASLKALERGALISMELLIQEASQFKNSLSQQDLDKYQKFETYHRG